MARVRRMSMSRKNGMRVDLTEECLPSFIPTEAGWFRRFPSIQSFIPSATSPTLDPSGGSIQSSSSTWFLPGSLQYQLSNKPDRSYPFPFGKPIDQNPLLSLSAPPIPIPSQSIIPGLMNGSSSISLPHNITSE